MTRAPVFGRLALPVGDGTVDAACFRREGEGPPVVYLHGLGSSLRDFLGAADAAGLPGRTLFALDFPGCGRTPRNGAELTMETLARFVRAALERLFPDPVVLVGHSMGGLAALLVAEAAPERVRAFVNVEGNLAPEDCFLSRKGAEWPAGSFGPRLRSYLRSSGKAGFLTYAERYRDEVHEATFRAYSRSIVEHSDGDPPLLDRFVSMTMPRLFVHGEENDDLSYLGRLAEGGVELAEIPESSHFPLYSNPAAFYERVRVFLDRVDAVHRPESG